MVRSICLLVLSLVILSSCSYFEEPTVVIRVPIVEESLMDAVTYINRLDERGKITVKYIPFDVRMETHPRVSGYLEISSLARFSAEGLSAKERLVAYINGMKSRHIFPVANTFWDRDGNEFRWLAEQVNENEKNGVKQQYIVLEDNELHLIW